MYWLVIKRIRPIIEKDGYFVEKIEDNYFLCTHLNDKEEKYYYLYPDYENGYVTLLNKK